MKKLTLCSIVLLLAACSTSGKDDSSGVLGSLGAQAGGGDGSSATDNRVGAGLDALKAVTISDAELKSVALQMRAQDDKGNATPANNKYAVRLAKLTAKHVNEDGMTLNFKVYLDPSINANASADGSVRVYKGLMDKMSDQELLGVIGHEIGHVKHGHTMSRLRTAYLASAGRKVAASSSGAVGALASSELGAIGEQLVKSQFSQSQETESDDYGLMFMKKHGYNVRAMESAFRKLAALGSSKGGLDQLLSTHPDSAKRADRMRDLSAKK